MGSIAPPSSNEDRCPLCEQANDCGQVLGNDNCWCQTTIFAPQLIEKANQLSPAQKRCICARCIEVFDKTQAGPDA